MEERAGIVSAGQGYAWETCGYGAEGGCFGKQEIPVQEMSNGPHNMSPNIFERAVIFAPSGQRDEGRRSVAGAYDNRDDGGAAKCLEGRRGESGEESGGQEALYNHQRAQ